MNSSTGISQRFVEWALLAVMVSPLMTLVMWFATAQQLSTIEDKLDTLQATEQRIPTSCTTQTQGAWIFKSTTESCTGVQK